MGLTALERLVREGLPEEMTLELSAGEREDG